MPRLKIEQNNSRASLLHLFISVGKPQILHPVVKLPGACEWNIRAACNLLFCRWRIGGENWAIYYPINCVNLFAILKRQAYQLKSFTSAHIGTESEWQAIKTQTRLCFTTGTHWIKNQFKFVNTLRGFGALTRVLEGLLDFGIFSALHVAVRFSCPWELDALWVDSGLDRVRRKEDSWSSGE